jgi:hypothetical protein
MTIVWQPCTILLKWIEFVGLAPFRRYSPGLDIKAGPED